MKKILTLIFLALILISCNNDNFSYTFESVVSEKIVEEDSTKLLNKSDLILQSLKDQNFEQLASFVHEDKGVLFSPYSHVSADAVTMTSAQLRVAKPTDMFQWGVYDGSGDPINLSIGEYFDKIVFAHDFTKVTQIGVDEFIIGSAIYDNNYNEIFPGTRFVVYHYPGKTYPIAGLDWVSLRLIFEEVDKQWFLVGIVRDCWTI